MIKNPGSPPSTGGTPGTVTSVSVATANGLAGTVANPTTTPAITLSTSVTGLVVGNGTALAAAAASDVLAPFPGSLIPAADISGLAASATTDTTNATNISSGTLNAARLPTNGANPTGTIGLAAVNGSATTWMRSDGAPLLSQSIVPTWTGAHIFQGGLTSSTTIIRAGASGADIRWSASSAGADQKFWEWVSSSGSNNIVLATYTDAGAAGTNAITVTRGTGTAITDVTLGNATNNPTYHLSGTGALTTGGNVILGTAGNKLQVKEGSNAAMGIATLSGGTITVSTNIVTANSRIFLTAQSLGTVAIPSGYGISARSAGVSFTILASAPTDTSTVAWMIVEPGP